MGAGPIVGDGSRALADDSRADGILSRGVALFGGPFWIGEVGGIEERDVIDREKAGSVDLIIDDAELPERTAFCFKVSQPVLVRRFMEHLRGLGLLRDDRHMRDVSLVAKNLDGSSVR
jgi:hypothetical protein